MPPASFQDLILRAANFWTEQGCIWLPPLNTSVARVTMAPEIFLRLWGDDLMKVCHVTTISRPRDSRGGASRLRRGQHVQFAAVLRPVPNDLLELFSRSLRALGFELERRDLQLVEYEHAISHLGARARGWRAQIDGITGAHVAIVDLVAGRRPQTEAVEIIYGLERLALLQQRAVSIDEVVWSQDSSPVRYGDVRPDLDEAEARYYAEIADSERLERRCLEIDDEIAACIADGLVRPAYDLLLEACHAFEILVARGMDPVREKSLEKRLRGRAQRCLELAEQQGRPEPRDAREVAED